MKLLRVIVHGSTGSHFDGYWLESFYRHESAHVVLIAFLNNIHFAHDAQPDPSDTGGFRHIYKALTCL